ncbi:MAG: aldo/keto reductase [Rhodobacteraceae bacterium]|nr:aldo/keto reductase [Paracoccaceae bacterium]
MHPFHKAGFQRIFGTWPLQGQAAEKATLAALETGYRAIDTAQFYQNETAVGRALKAAALPRDSLCITTKVMPGNYSSDRFRPSVEQSLADLGLDSVDILLLHWPPPDGNLFQCLEWLQDMQTRGLARRIGVSNFTISLLKETCAFLDVPLATNQIEFHPFLDQSRLMQHATKHRIQLSAYCALDRGVACTDPDLAAIGQRYGKTAAKVTLRWILQKGIIPISMSSRPARIRVNFAIEDFTLTHIDMDMIDRRCDRNLRIVNSEKVPHAPPWD